MQEQRFGISLFEVLAAIFILSIGLLGVLAVVPFGAFQMSKARHAEFASNMLANAAEEIVIRDMLGHVLRNFNNNVQPGGVPGFVWVEPYDRTNGAEPQHLLFVSQPNWQEIMRGGDDIEYTAHSDRRPDFTGRTEMQSTGQYTWFFTFPMPHADDRANDRIPVHVLACHRRVPGDDVFAMLDGYRPSMGGGTLTFSEADFMERLSQTRYVFVIWQDAGEVHGAWCRIVFLDKSDWNSPQVIVVGDLPGDADTRMQVYIPSGVLYKMKVEVRQ